MSRFISTRGFSSSLSARTALRRSSAVSAVRTARIGSAKEDDIVLKDWREDSLFKPVTNQILEAVVSYFLSP